MEKTLPALIAASQWELVAAAYCLKYNYNSHLGTYVATFVYCSTRCCGEERACCTEETTTVYNSVVNVWYFWAIVVVALFTLCLAVIAACCRWSNGRGRARRRTRVRAINIMPAVGRPQSQVPTSTSTPGTADRSGLSRFTFTLPGAPPPYYPASPPPSYDEVCRQSTRVPKDLEDTEETERNNHG
ncbi:uncharacterized protein LOC118403409 [Branchiostoma floridae]|uniref:Uncharacterized protein LOC118403409 n=1 Tax=Branchiostoma floridae TaxID=7739 RepID=C3YL28_BRAFL|nr:uncharacterized protein LOC118403409 [Branchiostoma floridae]|eukprot:XP_002603007.1 hypothetical protein BRAFLDRAFT_84742 [Branchiostoma floridae]